MLECELFYKRNLIASLSLTQKLEYRPLTEMEKRILDRLLLVRFVGRDELEMQLEGIRAAQLDASGTLLFHVSSDVRAAVRDGLVVEARCPDSNTGTETTAEVRVELYALDGKLWHMEIAKDDGSLPLRAPNPEEFACESPVLDED